MTNFLPEGRLIAYVLTFLIIVALVEAIVLGLRQRWRNIGVIKTKLLKHKDGLEDVQFATVVISDGFFSYVQHNSREEAEETAQGALTRMEDAFGSGITSQVRVILCEILRIEAIDRVLVEEREVIDDGVDGNTESPGFDDDVQGSL